jgi:hypothetical protein
MHVPLRLISSDCPGVNVAFCIHRSVIATGRIDEA